MNIIMTVVTESGCETLVFTPASLEKARLGREVEDKIKALAGGATVKSVTYCFVPVV